MIDLYWRICQSRAASVAVSVATIPMSVLFGILLDDTAGQIAWRCLAAVLVSYAAFDIGRAWLRRGKP